MGGWEPPSCLFPESERGSVLSDSLSPWGLHSPWNSSGQSTGAGSLSLLQGIFPTQESNWGLLHCGRVLHQLSCRGRPVYSTRALLSPQWPITPASLVGPSLGVLASLGPLALGSCLECTVHTWGLDISEHVRQTIGHKNPVELICQHPSQATRTYSPQGQRSLSVGSWPPAPSAVPGIEQGLQYLGPEWTDGVLRLCTILASGRERDLCLPV